MAVCKKCGEEYQGRKCNPCRKLYRHIPEVAARERELAKIYRSTPEFKERQRIYSAKRYPLIREKRALYEKIRYSDPEVRKQKRDHARYKATGWSPERVELYWGGQQGKCALCTCLLTRGVNGTGSQMHADHDHITGQPRALLCGRCNTNLGRFGDDPVRLEAAASYIRNYRL